MTSIEERIEKACKDGKIPGGVFVASDRDGKFRYEKAFGRRSLKDLSKSEPMTIDATMWLASCTKLLTAVAVMQCVEKGLFTLDEDVSRILTEFKDIKILKGFEEGPDGKDKAILVDNTKSVTLRHLLTHTSGLGYDVFNPDLMRFQATRGRTPNLKVKKSLIESMTFPLLFAPGEGWEYSVGLDWAGFMLERVTGLSLEEYLNRNVWDKLGVKSVCFHPSQNSAVLEKLVDISDREGGITMYGTAADPDGKLVYSGNTIWNMDTEGCAGGSGGYGAPLGYQKLLHSLAADDGKILSTKALDELTRPQLNDVGRAVFMGKLAIPEMNQVYGGFPMGTKVDYALGGSVVMQDLEGRKQGTMAWGGYPNLIWFLDRKTGMSGMMGSQINPPGDAKVLELYFAWEKEIYERAGKGNDGQSKL